jgi:hypothetical protein
VIHVATVHWRSDKWIDIQLRYLHRHLPPPFRVYAFLNDVPEHHRQKFYYTSIEPIVEHAIKLNLLADIIGFSADHDDDLLVFIDGDAFPIADLAPFISSPVLKSRRLAAIQRSENGGDIAPHPSFCITTVGLWRRIKGDWKAGYRWRNSNGDLVSDVGGNLLEILERHHIDWHPMLRSSRSDRHPLLGGIYDDLVYHHGNGFYQGTGRGLKARVQSEAKASFRGRLLDLLPNSGVGLRMKRRFHPVYAATERLRRENAALNDALFERLVNDDSFFRTLLQTDVPAPAPADGPAERRAG